MFAPEAPKTDGLKTSGKMIAQPFDEPSSPKAAEKPATAPGFILSPEGKPDQPKPTVRPDMSAVPGARDTIKRFDPLAMVRGMRDIAMNAARANAEKTRTAGAPGTTKVEIPSNMVRPQGSAPVAPPARPTPTSMNQSGNTPGMEQIRRETDTPAARRLAARRAAGMSPDQGKVRASDVAFQLSQTGRVK